MKVWKKLIIILKAELMVQMRKSMTKLQVFLRKKSYFLDVGLRKVMICLMRDIRLR